MKPIKTSYIISFFLMLLALGLFQWAGAKTKVSEHKRNIQKSDYLFLEALKYKELDSVDAYYDLLRAAYDLNPEDPYIGKDYGYLMILANYDSDSAAVNQGVRLMQRYQQAYPQDEIAGRLIGSVLTQMHRTPEALESWKLMYDANPASETAGYAYATALALTGDSANLRCSVEVYEGEERKEGKTIELSTRKIRSLFALDDSAAVLNEVHSLLSEDPRALDNLIFAGNVFMALDNPDSALVYFNRAVEHYPTNGASYYARAQYYVQTNDSVAYDREVFDALMHQDLEVETKLVLLRDYVSKLYEDTLQQERIITMFSTLVDQYPHDPEVRYLYGAYLASIGHYGDAVEHLRYSLDANPEDESRWQFLSSVYFSAQNYKGVEDVCSDAMHYFPTQYKFYYMSAIAANNLKNHDRALSLIDSAIVRVDSTDFKVLAELYAAKGDTYYQKNDFPAAYDNYKRALQFDSENALILNNIAYYLACADQDLDLAERYINSAIALEEKELKATTLDTYAWVQFKRKDYEKALEAINQVLEMDEEESSADVYEHAGDIYFMNGRPDEALDFWKKALKMSPENELLQRKVKHKTFFFK